jgi:hypothetical protein
MRAGDACRPLPPAAVRMSVSNRRALHTSKNAQCTGRLLEESMTMEGATLELPRILIADEQHWLVEPLHDRVMQAAEHFGVQFDDDATLLVLALH